MQALLSLRHYILFLNGLVGLLAFLVPTLGYAYCSTVSIRAQDGSAFSAQSARICSGSNYALKPSGGSQYRWTGQGSVGVDGSSFTPTVSGRVTLQGVNDCGVTQTTYVDVTLGSAPAASITGPSFICQGSSVTLTANLGTNAATYRWSTGATTQAITVSAAGTYSVTITPTYMYGCQNPSVSVTLVVNPLPTAVITPSASAVAFGQGDEVSLSANACSGCSYQWSFSADGTTGWTSMATTPVIVIRQTGFYRVAVTSQGCTSVSAPYGKVTVNPYNYIITNHIQKVGVTTPAQLNALTLGSIQQSITYFDDFGRPMQSVTTQGSPTGKDIVQPVQYDALGREAFQFLPYTDGTNGLFKTDALSPKNPLADPAAYATTKQYQFYQSAVATADGRAADATPFAERIFEASPLNRVIEQGAPGASWQVIKPGGGGRTVKMLSRTNLTGEVRQWSYGFASGSFGTGQAAQYYPAGVLLMSQSTDEHGNQVREFKDKSGLVVSKQVQFQGGTSPAATDFLTTDYLYDELSQLRMVIQPEGIAKATPPFTATADFINQWCFTYHYDEQGRMVEKKVPGAEVVYLIYNGRDQVVLNQDGAQRVRNEWSFIKYDGLGRPVMTGIYANDQKTSRTDVQALVNTFTGVNLYEEPVLANATNHGYTSRAFPVGGVGNASAWLPAAGKHSLSVTPYSAADGTGTKGATTTLSFNVVPSGTFTDNTLPSLSISAPLANSLLSAGSAVTLSASASDGDGIAKVEFFQSIAGGIAVKLGESTPPSSGTTYSYSWPSPPAGTYLITVKATDTKGGVTTKTLANVTVRGSILREVWSNLPGDLVANTNLVSGNQPTSSSQLTTLESPSSEDEYFGSRIRGYLTAPTTGNYTFWIAGDDNCELWLSTSSNPASKVKLAEVTTVGTDVRYTGIREWNKYASQKSVAIALSAGSSYYIEVVHKENDRGDNVAVGWMPPNTSTTVVIPGNVLTAFVPNLLPSANAGVDQTLQLSGTNTTVSTTLSGSGLDLDGTLTYGWQQRGGPVLATLSGATTASLGVSGLPVGTYLFRLTVTDNVGASEYDEVVLKVEAAPTQSIASLKLIDANTGDELLTLTNNSTVVLTSYAGKNLNIKAITAPTSVGSVQFTLDGTPSTSNAAPYLLQKASPASEYQVHSVTYYDGYDFDRDNAVDAYSSSTPANKESYRTDFQGEFTVSPDESAPAAFYGVVGKPTGSKVRVMNAAGNAADPEAWLWSATFYDDRGRAVQSQADNHLGGLDVSTTQYHFSGRIVRSFLKHTNTTTTLNSLTIEQRSVYDHASRVTEVYQQTNGEAEEPIAKNSYNELGQLISKKVGTDGTKELQSIDYRYNIRGWLTLINDAGLSGAGDLFGLRLLYDDAPTGNKQYNGNIGSMQWMSNFDRKGRNFKYQYDAANRLTEAAWANPSPTTGDFSVNGIRYDRNGNILSFNQNGLSSRKDNASPLFEAIDRLKYDYQGNRLSVVEDGISNQGLAGDFQDGNQQAVNPIAEYTYDANGNMYEDKNKGIRSIIYNRLNLPGTILMDNSGGNRIEYLYTATGTKLRKEVYQGGSLTTTTDYVGGLVFENKELQFVPTAEGRALTGKLASTSGFAYEYHYKDHLGNLRMAFRKSKTLRTYTATMEVGNPKEAEFANVNDLTRDGTYYQGSTGVKSAKLSTTQVLGPWKSIKVSRGDRVEAKVYAHYDGDAAASGGVSLQVYVGGAGITGGSAESGNNLPLLKNVGLGLSIVPNPSTTTLPKAYLKYIFYDSEGNYVSSSYKPVTTAAKGTNNNTVWQEIRFSDANTVKDAFWADQNGTLQVMVVNESNVPVWFDNLEIAHQEAMIVQENHYSPFGLNLVGIETQGQPNHEYQYNGMEKGRDLGLNLNLTLFRLYDPQLGRFHQLDPLADFYPSISSYHFANNNPILYADPTGLGAILDTWRKVKDGVMKLLGYQKHGSWKRTTSKERQVTYSRVHRGQGSDTKSSPSPQPYNKRFKIDKPPIDDVAFNFPRPETDEITDPREDDIPIPVKGTNTKFDKDILFKGGSDELLDQAVKDNILDDLVKALKDYPALTVLILGNTGTDGRRLGDDAYGSGNSALNQSTTLNGKKTHADGTPIRTRDVMNARAKAIRDILIENGISSDRIQTGPGTAFDTIKGRKTTFILKNTK